MSYTRQPSHAVATANSLGLVMIGTGLKITDDGLLSVKQQSGSADEPAAMNGTWNPKLISGPGGAAIQTESLGSDYMRFGPLLFASFDVKVTGINDSKKHSYVMLEGLPFLSSSNGGEYCGGVHISYFSSLSPNVSSLFGSVRQQSFSCDLWCQLTEHTELIKLQRAHLQTGSRIQGYLLASISH